MLPHNETLRPLGGRRLSATRWLLLFLGFVAVNGAFLGFSGSTSTWGSPQTLIVYLLYMSIACTFLPLPTAWIVLYAAREVDPLSVALLGSIGTCIANLHDYYVIDALLRKKKVNQVRNTRVYKSSVAWFGRAPFLTLSAASFLPIPIDVVRLLAVSTGYPRRWYVLATFAGRLPRYLILAYFGYEWQPSNAVIFVVFLATVAIGIVKGLSKLKRKQVETNRTILGRGV